VNKFSFRTVKMAGAVVALLAVAIPVSLTAAQSSTVKNGTREIIYSQATTDNNDHVRCHHQPCSDDGKWQATQVDLKIGPVSPGKHLENVTMTSDGSVGAQFCSRPNLAVEVQSATANVKCWSLPVQWTLQGTVVGPRLY
jgi:hypothetical protein